MWFSYNLSTNINKVPYFSQFLPFHLYFMRSEKLKIFHFDWFQYILYIYTIRKVVNIVYNLIFYTIFSVFTIINFDLTLFQHITFRISLVIFILFFMFIISLLKLKYSIIFTSQLDFLPSVCFCFSTPFTFCQTIQISVIKTCM